MKPTVPSSGKFRAGQIVRYVERLRRKGHTGKYEVLVCTADCVTFTETAIKGKNFSPEYFELA